MKSRYAYIVSFETPQDGYHDCGIFSSRRRALRAVQDAHTFLARFRGCAKDEWFTDATSGLQWWQSTTHRSVVIQLQRRTLG